MSSPDGHSSVFGHSTVEFSCRLILSLVLGIMAYLRINYDVICTLHLWSHLMPWMVGMFLRNRRKKNDEKLLNKGAKNKKNESSTSDPPSLAVYIVISSIFLFSIPFCLVLCRLLSDPSIYSSCLVWMPKPMRSKVIYALNYMFPIQELTSSYEIVTSFFSDQKFLHDMLKHLLFVTFHIQMGMGHIGIAFLTSEQRRKNILIRMDVDNSEPKKDKKKRKHVACDEGIVNGSIKDKDQKFDPSRKFRRSAAPFILFTVIPYMFQIIFMGNLNNFAFMCVRNQIHRSVRIQELFNHDVHLTALANDSASSPETYATAMDTVVSTAYDLLNRKLFSLPKLIILPGVISRQPSLLIKIFPFIFMTDMLKGRIVASVTDRVEQFQLEARDLNSIRQKVEQFDLKNAELLRRSGLGATKFTERRWDELTLEYQAKVAAGDLLKRTRGFYQWLQRNFVFVVLIDCALAKLLAEGNIIVSEIFVFTRAIEDVIDLILIRSRNESELATLMTQVEKLKTLDSVWGKSKDGTVLPCRIPEIDESNLVQHGIVLNNLQYSRGTATVSVEHLVLEPGIYAVTGPNGSGKSTLFKVLMACETNERPIELHESIELATPIHQWDLSDRLVLPKDSCKVPDEGCEVGNDEDGEEIPVTSVILPSSDVVEISQNFYWPLYTKPIDWIYQKHITSDMSDNERIECVLRVAKELQSLSFAQSQNDLFEEGTADKNTLETILGELQMEKEDWFGELSGGQKSKVELVRKVFLRDFCPSVLLIDETMAPLDPSSKSLVMQKIKSFCNKSVVLVIYHTDVGRGIVGETSGDIEECVPSNDFFDHNLHVQNKHLVTRHVC